MHVDVDKELAEAVRDAVELGSAAANRLVAYNPDKHRHLLHRAANVEPDTYGSVVMSTVARMAEHGVAVRLDVDGEHVLAAILASRS